MSEELDLMDDLDGREDTQKGMFMTFQIADECYGIAITYVQEIVGI